METPKELITRLACIISVCLCSFMSAQAQTDPTIRKAFTTNQKHFVDRVSEAVGVSLPEEYEAKVKGYVDQSKFLSLEQGGASKRVWTKQFITQQMKTSWGIDSSNQLLFVWDAIYNQITKSNFYTNEDGNQKRRNDYDKVKSTIETCGKEYVAYMRHKTIAEKQEIIRLIHGQLTLLTQSYNLYKQKPNAYKADELTRMRKDAQATIQECKKYNIDYKQELSPEVRQFYGME